MHYCADAQSNTSCSPPVSFAVAELQREVEALKAEVDTLKARLAEVMEKVG